MVEMKNNIRLEVTAGDTVAWNVKLNNITENLRLAYFTVKENPDDEPLIQKTLDAGITLVDNRAYRDQKTYKIQLQSEDTAGLSPDLQYMYDLKVAIGNVVKTIISGVFVVRESVTSPTLIIVDDAEVEAVDLVTADFETVPATNGIEYEQDPVANEKIGDMADLNTEQKSTLVGAINEVNNKASNTKEDVDKILDGTVAVPNAESATNAINASKTDFTNGIWYEFLDVETYELPDFDGVYQCAIMGEDRDSNFMPKTAGLLNYSSGLVYTDCIIDLSFEVSSTTIYLTMHKAEVINGQVRGYKYEISFGNGSAPTLTKTRCSLYIKRIR